jgi:hypothetical protein
MSVRACTPLDGPLDDVGSRVQCSNFRYHSRVLGLDFTKPLLYTLFLGSEYAVNPTEQREEKSCATTKEEEREWDRRDGCAPMSIP